MFRLKLGSPVVILQVGSSESASIARLQASIKYIGRRASWAVVLYDHSALSDWDNVAQTARNVRAMLIVRTGRRPSHGTRTLKGRKFYPKLLFWLQAMDLIERHEYVWLADEDISFRGFDHSGYWHQLHTAFAQRHRAPPLISQPVINATVAAAFGDPAGKWVELINAAAFWRGSGVAIVESSYVEQQAALVHSRFFIHGSAVWETLAKAQHAAGSDFGLDTIWCGAAQLHAPERVGCAVLTVCIEHDDTRALNWTSDDAFVRRSRQLEKEAYTAIAPLWWMRTQQLRQELALHEFALFEGSNRTCLEPGADASCRQQHGGRGSRAGHNGMRLATRLPCSFTRMARFPRHYAHVGDMLMSAHTQELELQNGQQRVSTVILGTNQTTAAALIPNLASAPPKGCCRRGVWKCCY